MEIFMPARIIFACLFWIISLLALLTLGKSGQWMVMKVHCIYTKKMLILMESESPDYMAVYALYIRLPTPSVHSLRGRIIWRFGKWSAITEHFLYLPASISLLSLPLHIRSVSYTCIVITINRRSFVHSSCLGFPQVSLFFGISLSNFQLEIMISTDFFLQKYQNKMNYL